MFAKLVHGGTVFGKCLLSFPPSSFLHMKHSLRLFLAAVPLLAACHDNNNELPQPTPPVVEQGQVRIVNNLAIGAGQQLVPGGSIRLVVDSKELGPAAVAGAAAPYQAVAVGKPAVQIMLPYSTGSGWVQINSLAVAKDKRYSLFTYSAGTMNQARLVEEQALPTPVAGKAYVRVLNVAAEPTPVRIEEPQASSPLYSKVTWGSVTSYQAVDARTYTLQTTRTNGTQAQLFTQSTALAPGKAYTLVLRGSTYPDAAGSEKLAFDVVVDE
jgi:hypothetical protein